LISVKGTGIHVFDSKMLLRRFRSKREDVTGFLRKSPDEELHNLVPFPRSLPWLY
jgi:hypothetical protein